jgi:hypothetical protein
MAVATWQDVAVALGRPTSDFTADQQAQITWWLGGLERFIINRLGPVADLNADDVKYVEAEAAAEKVRRTGTSESSITVTVDDGAVTRRYEAPVSASDITDEWWNLLDQDASAATGSIRPGFDADTVMWPVSTPPTYPWVDPTWRPIS